MSGRSDRDVLSYRSIRRAHRRPAFDPDGTEHGRNECRYPYAHDFSGLPERTNAAAAAYARACVEVARQWGLRAIDIWSRMQRFPGWEKSFLRYARTLSCRLPRRRHRGDGSSRTQMKVCHFLPACGCRDGLHLTPRGNRVLFEEVVFALKDANLSLEALPADLPLFSDIDPDNPVKSFEDQE